MVVNVGIDVVVYVVGVIRFSAVVLLISVVVVDNRNEIGAAASNVIEYESNVINFLVIIIVVKIICVVVIVVLVVVCSIMVVVLNDGDIVVGFDDVVIGINIVAYIFVVFLFNVESRNVILLLNRHIYISVEGRGDDLSNIWQRTTAGGA